MLNSIKLAICIAGSAAGQAAMAQNNEYQGVPVSTTVFIRFENGGAAFRPTAEDAATMSSAKDAALVSIRGRTSTGIPTAKDELLAFARASAARSYLITHGVSPLKITLNYASAADFIADNSTAMGHRLNQRVEIELVYVPGLYRDAEVLR